MVYFYRQLEPPTLYHVAQYASAEMCSGVVVFLLVGILPFLMFFDAVYLTLLMKVAISTLKVHKVIL